MMEYIVSSLRIVMITKMIDVDDVEERLLQLMQLEEERFVVGYHQNDEKERQNVWHDRHNNKKQFQVGGFFYV